MIPYLQDLCEEDALNCDKFQTYADYCWEHMWDVLGATDKSQDDFVKDWSKQTAELLELEEADVLRLYDKKNDLHDTNNRVRQMFKVSSQMGVANTPTVFLNNVKLTSIPSTIDEWHTYLLSLVDNQ